MNCGTDCRWYVAGSNGVCGHGKKGYTGYLTRCDELKCFEPKESVMETKEPLTKVCKHCGRELPIEDFSRNRNGRIGICKECMTRKRLEKIGLKFPPLPSPPSLTPVKEARVEFDLRECHIEDILAELRRRGYSGTLTKSVEV